MLSRRQFMLFGPSAGLVVSSARADDHGQFWEKKPPTQWTRDEITWMLNASPWAQQADVFLSHGRGIYAPLETPLSPGKRPGFAVRWESAQVVLDALRTQAPDSFRDRYVIGVPGKTLFTQELTSWRVPESQSLKAMRQATRLKFGQDKVQVNLIEHIRKGPHKGVLFYFPRHSALTSGQDSILFATAIGNTEITARFSVAEMLYHGSLVL